MEKNNWQAFFDQFAPDYLKEPWTRATSSEADFIERELRLQKGMSLLDVGCGTGRHSLELTRRGYRMTGLDLSGGMLAEARKAAQAEGLAVSLVQADATDFALDTKFDAAICLCDGAFGLLGTAEEPFLRDLKILRNIAVVLKAGAPLLMTVSNAYRYARMYSDGDVAAGVFDPINCCEKPDMAALYADVAKDLTFRQKAFTPTEMRMLFYMAGFETLFVFGGTAGAWNKQMLRLDEYEVMILGRKNEE